MRNRYKRWRETGGDQHEDTDDEPKSSNSSSVGFGDPSSITSSTPNTTSGETGGAGGNWRWDLDTIRLRKQDIDAYAAEHNEEPIISGGSMPSSRPATVNNNAAAAETKFYFGGTVTGPKGAAPRSANATAATPQPKKNNSHDLNAGKIIHLSSSSSSSSIDTSSSDGYTNSLDDNRVINGSVRNDDEDDVSVGPNSVDDPCYAVAATPGNFHLNRQQFSSGNNGGVVPVRHESGAKTDTQTSTLNNVSGVAHNSNSFSADLPLNKPTTVALGAHATESASTTSPPAAGKLSPNQKMRAPDLSPATTPHKLQNSQQLTKSSPKVLAKNIDLLINPSSNIIATSKRVQSTPQSEQHVVTVSQVVNRFEQNADGRDSTRENDQNNHKQFSGAVNDGGSGSRHHRYASDRSAVNHAEEPPSKVGYVFV